MNSRLLSIISVAALVLSAFAVCLATPADADESGDAKPGVVESLVGYGDDRTLETGMSIIYDFTSGSENISYTVSLKDETVGGFVGEIAESNHRNIQKHVGVLDTVLGFDVTASGTYPAGVTVTKDGATVTVTGTHTKTVGIYSTVFTLDLRFTFSSEDLSAPGLEVVSTEGTYRTYGTHYMGRMLESTECDEGTAVTGEACTFDSTTTHTSYSLFMEPSYGYVFGQIHLYSFPLSKSDMEFYATVTATGNTKVIAGLECQEYNVANGSGSSKGVLYAHNNEVITYSGTWRDSQTEFQVRQFVPGGSGGVTPEAIPCITENLDGYGDDKMLETGMRIIYTEKTALETETITVRLVGETIDGFVAEKADTRWLNVEYLPSSLETILGFDFANPATYPAGVSVVKNGATLSISGTHVATVGIYTTTFNLDLAFTFSSENLSDPGIEIISTQGHYSNISVHYLSRILESTEYDGGTAVEGKLCEFAANKDHTTYNEVIEPSYGYIFAGIHSTFPLTKSDVEFYTTVTATGNTKMFSGLDCKEYNVANGSGSSAGVLYAHNNEVIAYEGTWFGQQMEFLTQQYVPGGTHDLVTDPSVAPTCETTGLTEGKHCSICGKVIVKQKVIPRIPSVTVLETDKTFTTEIGDVHYLSALDVENMTAKAVADSAYSLVIKSSAGELKMDNAALRNLVAGDAEVVFEKVATIPGVSKDATVFEISVGDTHDLKGGAVTVTVPYDGPTDDVKVYCIVAGAITESFDVSFADGKAVFSVPHLSTFAIMKDGPDAGGSGYDVTSLSVLGVAFAIMVIGSAVIVVRSRYD